MNKVDDYRGENLVAMTNGEIFEKVQEELQLNDISMKAAIKLFGEIQTEIDQKSRLEMIAASVRVKSIEKEQPVRLKKISELLNVDTKDVARICKQIENIKGESYFPDAKNYAVFLLDRLDAGTMTTKDLVKEKIDVVQEDEQMRSKSSTSIGMAVVAHMTDLKKKELAEEIATSTATIRTNERQIAEILEGE